MLHNNKMIYVYISFMSAVKIITLLSLSLLNGTNAFVTGWGRCDMTGREICLPRGSIYYPNEKLDPMLRSIMFEIKMPNFYCAGYKRHDINLYPGMLCVGEAREENPVAPCLAVPGAPLVVQGSLAGLQSWGFGCGYSHDLPLVYTDIQYYYHWVTHNMQVLSTLSRQNYTTIFEATRAYITCTWLMETRLIKPNTHDDVSKILQQSEIDRVLATLAGVYYDIRDFVDGGQYHEAKLSMMNNMWSRDEKLAMLNKTKQNPHNGVPFVPNYFLIDDSDDSIDDDNSISMEL